MPVSTGGVFREYHGRKRVNDCKVKTVKEVLKWDDEDKHADKNIMRSPQKWKTTSRDHFRGFVYNDGSKNVEID